MPLISFITPFHNRLNLLKEAIGSVLSSEFKDVEIILVDDASGAGGLNEFLECMSAYKNIVYIRQNENRGPGAARNNGMTAAGGDWIFFLDSDDVILSVALPALAEFLENHSDSDIVYMPETAYKWPDGRIEKRRIKDASSEGVFEHIKNSALMNGANAWTACYKKDFITGNRITFPATYNDEDICFFLSAFLTAKQISFFPQCFYQYHYDSPLSLVTTYTERHNYKSGQVINGKLVLFDMLIKLFEYETAEAKRKNIAVLISDYSLFSLFDPQKYKDNVIINERLSALHDILKKHSENWVRPLYLSPCFLSAYKTAVLIKEWGGRIEAFIDNNPTSQRALGLRNASGLDIFKLDESDALVKRGGGGGLSYSAGTRSQ
jgi:glycosyltransferase involved in cell wall biosynthesis